MPAPKISKILKLSDLVTMPLCQEPLEITNFLGEYGDQKDSFGASQVVAGPDQFGRYWRCNIEFATKVQIQ